MTVAARKTKFRITVDFQPHSPEQASILSAVEDELDVTCGRRFGKSKLAKAWITGLHPGATWGAVHTPGGRFWYVAPTLRPVARDAYRELKKSLGTLVKHKNDSDLELTLFNDAVIEFKSAENPDNLLGPGLDGLVLDEKGVISAHTWDTVLSPMLADPPERCRRRVLRVGTPRGKKHWTYREHVLGLEGPHGVGGRRAFQFPTWCRPGMQAFCDRQRKIRPANAYDQEYGAIFLDSAAGFFQKIPEAHDGKPAPTGPEKGASYTAGMDFAHTDDWNTVAVVQASPKPSRIAALERFGRAPWPATKGRGVAVFRKWNVVNAMIDATPGGAPGEVTIEAFRPEWSRLEGFDFREHGSREDLLANLAIMLETGELTLPGTYENPAFPVLTAELEAFEYEILPSGRPRAKAKRGMNDDAVMGAALGAWCAKRAASIGYGSRKTY